MMKVLTVTFFVITLCGQSDGWVSVFLEKRTISILV
jgi:hypothetical protein